MPSELDEFEIQNTLKRIAYINISKIPGYKKSSDSCLYKQYLKWKKILFNQIELYTPNIIIFGRTFDFFKEDLQIIEKSIYTKSGKWDTNTYKKNNVILIKAFHPSGKDNDYVKSIVNAARKVLK